MAEKEKEPKKTPKPVTDSYKILQELKAMHKTLNLILEEIKNL